MLFGCDLRYVKPNKRRQRSDEPVFSVQNQRNVNLVGMNVPTSICMNMVARFIILLYFSSHTTKTNRMDRCTYHTTHILEFNVSLKCTIIYNEEINWRFTEETSIKLMYVYCGLQ